MLNEVMPSGPSRRARQQDRRGYGGQAAIQQRVGEGRSRRARGTESLQTCMGLFLSSSHFWLVGDSLFGAGMPFFVPSPAIRFAERAEGVTLFNYQFY